MGKVTHECREAEGCITGLYNIAVLPECGDGVPEILGISCLLAEVVVGAAVSKVL
jgi:hypothetical protein